MTKGFVIDTLHNLKAVLYKMLGNDKYTYALGMGLKELEKDTIEISTGTFKGEMKAEGGALIVNIYMQNGDHLEELIYDPDKVFDDEIQGEA